MKIASAIDIGSNTALILIGRRIGELIDIMYENIRTTRLGEGVKKTGEISDVAIVRMLNVMTIYKKVLDDNRVSSIRCVGTSALRKAKNNQILIDEVYSKTGIRVEVIDEGEEARLSFISAKSSLNIKGACTVLDVGSYSSQVSWGENSKIENRISLPIGCLIMKETMVRESGGYDVESVEDIIADNIKKVEYDKKDCELVLVGGSAVAGATLLLGLEKYERRIIHGISVGYQDIKELVVSLALMSEDEIRRRMAFEPERADIIVPGLIIITRFMKTLGFDKARVCWWGLTYGILNELLFL
ncbi:MAG: Ppx/GppA phosphatase family protein [bacterium]